LRGRSPWVARAAAAALTVLTAVAVAGCNGASSAVPTPVTTATTAPPAPVTTLATLHGSVPKYPAPNMPSDGTVPGQWYGYTSILPVVATRPGWLEVRLAQRPNQSTAWITTNGVTLSSDRYRMVLTLSTSHLQVYDGNQEIGDFPAGIGTTTDPTPTGDYFIAFKAPSLGPGYGNFEFATSDHSDAIQSWEGTGDAVTAIHGPIDAYADQEIGTTGARISHGCIRLHYSALNQLANVPIGTPFTVVA
jgi:lipoprotein-anchoring transpeptidase ErfK/SrfK